VFTALCVTWLALAAPAPAVPVPSLLAVAADSMSDLPVIGPGDEPIVVEPVRLVQSDRWLRAPFGDNLLTDPARWRGEGEHPDRYRLRVDYNRVDQLRVGVSGELQRPYTMYPRLGGMLEYSFGRKRTLYGLQLEQPLLPPGRLAFGVSMVRRTDHSELQQVDDIENSIDLLFVRADFRDYFEREGYGYYLSWRVPDFSTASVHYRSDDYRSLEVDRGTRSWFNRDNPLRDNPAIDDGTVHSVLLRFERLTQNSHRNRAGLYHWIEFERAGGGLEGDFTYSRVLADVRSVLRLSPTTTLSLRGVGGHGWDGALPRQKEFTAGGVDGLRAHDFSEFRGNQMMLAQAEYDVGLWKLDTEFSPGGIHALAFVDLGRAWSSADHHWDVGAQHLAFDGGFGLATSDDGVRIYVAHKLQDPNSEFVYSFRLQRPF
jgi:hypothetical protein